MTYATFSITYDGQADCKEFNSKAKATTYANRIAKDADIDVVYIQVGDGDDIINIKL